MNRAQRRAIESKAGGRYTTANPHGILGGWFEKGCLPKPTSKKTLAKIAALKNGGAK